MVATLVSVSIQDLRQNSQDISAFYLQNIYLLLADSNSSHVSIPPTLPNPPPFSPPLYAIWVNSLWFLSLAISLTCGLLATLLKQWALRYVKSPSRRYSPHKRARIRAFFAEGVEKLHLPWAVEAVPTLLHLSLFIFFAGLVIFLFNVHHTVFTAVTWWVGLCTTVYGCITVMPVFRPDSPYYAPLSSSAWYLVHGASYSFARILGWFNAFSCLGTTFVKRMKEMERIHRKRKRLVEGMGKTTEEKAFTGPSDIDARALMRTFDSLDQDKDLERFFAGIPGFCTSDVVSNPHGDFIEPNKWRLSEAVIVLMQNSLTSNLVGESDRQRRSLICAKAMQAASLPIHLSTCHKIINGEWGGLLNFVEFGQLLMDVNREDPIQNYYSASMLAIIIARWDELNHVHRSELVTSHLGISRRQLRGYLRNGDSLLLANCIHLLRNILDIHWEPFGLGSANARRKVLESVSEFRVEGTLPKLQHDFCALWNQFVDMARITHVPHVRFLAIEILTKIHHVYLALHPGGYDAPTVLSDSTPDAELIRLLQSSFLPCSTPSHGLHPEPRSLSQSDMTTPYGSRVSYRPPPPIVPTQSGMYTSYRSRHRAPYGYPGAHLPYPGAHLPQPSGYPGQQLPPPAAYPVYGQPPSSQNIFPPPDVLPSGSISLPPPHEFVRETALPLAPPVDNLPYQSTDPVLLPPTESGGPISLPPPHEFVPQSTDVLSHTTGAESTSAESTGAGSGAGSTGAGSTGAGSTGAESG